jgi:hypothetical protein
MGLSLSFVAEDGYDFIFPNADSYRRKLINNIGNYVNYTKHKPANIKQTQL